MQQKDYVAFISYNSKDDSWAKWLQSKLEHYNLPTVVANENGHILRTYDKNPEKFKIFRYVSDLVAKTLSEGLREELDRSEYLIVICSPNSAHSKWVGKEIQHFIDTERKNKIIPFIIDGTPYSGDIRECFNEVLKNAFEPGDLLGVNINDYGDTPWIFRKRKAVAKTVSLLIGLPDAYGFIWNRYRHRMYVQIFLRTLLAVAVLAVVFSVWKTNQPIDVKMRLNEATIHNEQLPPLKDAVVTITLDNETKTDTISSLKSDIKFTNIPHRYLGKEVRITAACRDFKDVDTILTLSKSMVLNVSRDSSVYGDIHFYLWNPRTEKAIANTEVELAGYKAISDSKGYVSLFIPLEFQQTAYRIKTNIPLETDTIYLPCGDNDVVLAR